MMKRFLIVATLLYLAGVAALTLGPQPTNASSQRMSLLIVTAVDRFVTSGFTSADLEFCENIAMFAPLGLLLVLLLGRRRWWLAVLGCAALTVFIESVQTVIPSRVSDPRDLVANTAGALAGVLIALPFAGRARRTRTASTA
jgi:glycopeptide antibiotics resistance protein